MVASAQGHPNYTIQVTCSEKVPATAASAEFTAVIRPKVEERLEKSVTYEWTVSAGTITEGQGTSKIKVDYGSEIDGSSITANVRVPSGEFYFQDLSNACTTSVEVSQRVIDEMERPNCERLQAAMDMAGAEMSNNPADRLFAVVHPGKTESSFARGYASQVSAWVRTRRFDPNRVTIAFGAERDVASVVLIAVPPGAKEPKTEKYWERRSTFADAEIPKRPKLIVTETEDENPCFSDDRALEDLGSFLKGNPSARARIVIKIAGARDFREQAKHIRETLSAEYGVSGTQVVLIHVRTRPWPNAPMKETEYWLLPKALGR
jgi:hypothetical protein